jgi:hypothetical protein
MATAAVQALQLRRENRDLEQEAEHLEERAKSSLTTEEASARFTREAEAKHNLIRANKERIAMLEGSQQTSLFN